MIGYIKKYIFLKTMKKVFIVLIMLFIIGCGNVPLKITSSAFENNKNIPSKYTCDGKNINPPLIFKNIPSKTKSLVLIMDDPDIPKEVKKSRNIEVFDHWIIFNIPPSIKKIDENAIPEGVIGKNSAGNNNYTSPCPPSQFEPKTHRYFFKLYALDIVLDLDESANKEEVESSMEGHILEKAELIGLYSRK